MPTTTNTTVTDHEISYLRAEAYSAGDYYMAVICDLALDGEIDVGDYTVLSSDHERRIASMSAETARAKCERAILAAR